MSFRVAILLTIAAPAWACSCGGTSPSVKQMWQETPVVFVGTVELADPDLPGDQAIFQSQSVRIRIDEAFKGILAGETIELHQAGSDCAAKFRTGQRAVFYLYRDSKLGTWIVPPCTHALGNAESGSDDLLFLRGLPTSAIGTRLSGTVALFEQRSQHEYYSDAVPDVKVRITGPRGFTRDTVTNAAGAYEVYGLRPGAYSVHIEFPSGVTGGSSTAGATSTVRLPANGSITANFTLRPDTRLSARVTAADGFPPPQNLCFELEPVQTPDETLGFECSKIDGSFTFSEIPPGQYRLLTHDTVVINSFDSRSSLYYPGVRDRAQAGIVTVEPGKYVDSVEIRIPSNEVRKRLSGELVYSDGSPASGSTVTFTSPAVGYSESASVGSDG